MSSEASGAALFGRQGTVSGYSEGKYHVVTSSGTFQVAQEDLSLVCFPEYTMPENNGDLSTTFVDFLPVTAETNLSEDQQLWLGWQALR